jgi:hypothetical protein
LANLPAQLDPLPKCRGCELLGELGLNLGTDSLTIANMHVLMPLSTILENL